jgi:hypothetical protein
MPDQDVMEPELSRLVKGLFVKSDPQSQGAEGVLLKGGWPEHLRSDPETYARFARVWLRYTTRLLHNVGSVAWHCVEGYDLQVRAVLQVFSATDIFGYSDDHRAVADALLANEGLFGPLIRCLFLKTKYGFMG